MTLIYQPYEAAHDFGKWVAHTTVFGIGEGICNILNVFISATQVADA